MVLGKCILSFFYSPHLTCFSVPCGVGLQSLVYHKGVIGSFFLFTSRSGKGIASCWPRSAASSSGSHPSPRGHPWWWWWWGGGTSHRRGKQHRLNLFPDWTQIVNRKGVTVLLSVQWHQFQGNTTPNCRVRIRWLEPLENKVRPLRCQLP